MRVVPKNIGAKIDFFRSHLAVWQANAEALGLSEETVSAVEALLEEAQAAYAEQRALQQKAESATQALHDVLGRLGTAGASAIQQVRATATFAGDNSAYNLAQIPAPAEPAPIPAPGKPYALKVTLKPCSGLLLKWACDNPRNATGTMYQLSRQVYTGSDGPFNPGAPFEPIGLVGKREFLDETLPPGTQFVIYEIRAARSTKVGDANRFPVSFYNSGPKASQMMQVKGNAIAA